MSYINTISCAPVRSPPGHRPDRPARRGDVLLAVDRLVTDYYEGYLRGFYDRPLTASSTAHRLTDEVVALILGDDAGRHAG